MIQGIAIVGLSCRYPDASNIYELWLNTLAGRQAFRRIPSVRTRLEDYFSSDHNHPDTTYATQAAVLTNYSFDRNKYKISGKSFRSADLTHWLALDMATQALDNAGFENGEGLPKESTGVFVGNTLTGEFSRAQLMRLRWPYVRRTLTEQLDNIGWSDNEIKQFLAMYEESYKAPFEPINEETLAGGLSNTIPGRICNYFDLGGGGYTIDGACSSSLLAVVNGCNQLVTGEIDVAIVGGVDLSLDPFELVGFAKTGALAPGKMKVFDQNSQGFIPGEGCGFAVLMRADDALAMNKEIYAVIKGWGVSSDGSGGLTRPEKKGQFLAISRAYRKAGYGIDTVQYFEAHGTGTAIGDNVEIKTLDFARKSAGAADQAVVGSIKANIGHTKAAAGIAGLIKAVMAVHEGIIPPNVGCETPNHYLLSPDSTLRVTTDGMAWSSSQMRRAGVSSFGFGGINVHLSIEYPYGENTEQLTSKEQTALNTRQDYELLLVGSDSKDDLRTRLETIVDKASIMSQSELSDLATSLYSQLSSCRYRTAIVVKDVEDVTKKVSRVLDLLQHEMLPYLDNRQGIYVSSRSVNPKIGFLFPGQGAPVTDPSGILTKRFPEKLKELDSRRIPAMNPKSPVDTAIAQPAIVTASLAGLRILEELGVHAKFAIGHSLGELVALHWAGSMSESELIDLSVQRGNAMSNVSVPKSGMASLMVSADKALELIAGTDVVISAYNSPAQTVISGTDKQIESIVEKATHSGYSANKLPVSHAFHSPLMRDAVPVMQNYLSKQAYGSPNRCVFSTVTGDALSSDTNLRELISNQLELPVLFSEAIQKAGSADLLIEVGPGSIMTGLSSANISVPVVSLNVGSKSFFELLNVVAATYVSGCNVNFDPVFGGRYTKPFNLAEEVSFLENPCEKAPEYRFENPVPLPANHRLYDEENSVAQNSTDNALNVLTRFIAAKTELEIENLNPGDGLLQDLHLNSISIGEIIAQSAQVLGVRPPTPLQALVTATIQEVADELEKAEVISSNKPVVEGVDSWVQPFRIKFTEKPLVSTRMEHSRESVGKWTYRTLGSSELGIELENRVCSLPGRGFIVYVPDVVNENTLKQLFDAGKLAAKMKRDEALIIIQHRPLAGGLARTVCVESNVPTLVLNIPNTLLVVDKVCEELKSLDINRTRYEEVTYDESLIRYVRTFQPWFLEDGGSDLQLEASDVFLITGGARGIGFECALRLAMKYGIKLGFIGRSNPTADPELQSNLERLRLHGIDFAYAEADVTSNSQVRNAIKALVGDIGVIRGVIHAAGTNSPQMLATMEYADFEMTVRVKVDGLKNVLNHVDESQLKVVVAFGSVIAETGMYGEAHYAVANEWLTNFTREYKIKNPLCKVICLEWSVWSQLGMGERLGSIANLLSMGITPITPEIGVDLFEAIITSESPVSLIVSGRFGDICTVDFGDMELPLSRFVEDVKIHYPNLELITECVITPHTDPYIEEHVLGGQTIFPGVMGIEAMAEVASAIVDIEGEVFLESVEFVQPILIHSSTEKKLRIRIVALRRTRNKVEVAIRTESTNFMMDHFRMQYLVSNPHKGSVTVGHAKHKYPIRLHPDRDLYGGVLFQTGRFQRVLKYETLSAFECSFQVDSRNCSWFGGYLPSALSCLHPGVRDAAMHGIQPCIPHKRVLPISARRIITNQDVQFYEQPCQVWAKEIWHDDNTFEYDIEICNSDGLLAEKWEGLKLKSVSEYSEHYERVNGLVVPFVQRVLDEVLSQRGAAPDTLSIALIPNDLAVSEEHTDEAIQVVTGCDTAVVRRWDGKPEVLDRVCSVSASHTDTFTLAVSCDGITGCDIENVPTLEPPVWDTMLGENRFQLAGYVSKALQEDPNTSCTRIWAANECLIKSGIDATSAPLTMDSFGSRGYVTFKSGSYVIVTFLVTLEPDKDTIIALLWGEKN